MTTSPLMTTAEVADYTRLSVETLRYFRQRDEGPPFAKLGRRVMYRRRGRRCLDRVVRRYTERIARKLTLNGIGAAARPAVAEEPRGQMPKPPRPRCAQVNLPTILLVTR